MMLAMSKSPQRVILVTGGAGFIGSHLCEALAREGQRVISLDNYFTGLRENHVPAKAFCTAECSPGTCEVHRGVEYREGHTKDIARHIPETPDIIFHLGEYARVDRSFEEPEVVWDMNNAGTFGVVEFWRQKKCKLVYAGSSTKFGDGGLGRVQSPYAWTKASNTELVGNYARWFNLPYAITYFYNVYGPRERAGKYGTLIELFRHKCLSGESLTVTAPGTQRRNFTHVDDIVNGLLLVGERGEGDDYGLGAAESYSILDIARMFGGEIVMMPELPGTRMSSTLDTSKAQALGWQAVRKVEDYIAAAKHSPLPAGLLAATHLA